MGLIAMVDNESSFFSRDSSTTVLDLDLPGLADKNII